MLKLDHKVVIGYTTINVIGVTTVFVKYPKITKQTTVRLSVFYLLPPKRHKLKRL